MTEHSFNLVPFPDPHTPKIEIQGGIARVDDQLMIQYIVRGEINRILFPAPVNEPARKMELWLGTCFEFFLALPDQPQYWEFNLSPSGEWNAFHMDGYRRIGFREEERIDDLRVQYRNDLDCIVISTVANLSRILESQKTIQAGVTSVIQTRDGNETYWALGHPQTEPDFHWRESFTLVLEGADRP